MDNIKITYKKEKREFPKNTSVVDIIKTFDELFDEKFLGIKVENSVKKWNEKITKDSEFVPFDDSDSTGNKIYQAGLKYIFIVAVKDLYGKEAQVSFLNSLDKGLYTAINVPGKTIEHKDLDDIYNKMKEISNQNLVFERITVEKKEAINYFIKINESEKAKNIKNIAGNTITLYKLNSYYNYFYNDMPYSTKVINRFCLDFISDNKIVLTFPTIKSKGIVLKYNHFPKTLNNFEIYRNWIEHLNLRYISNVNDLISTNQIRDFIATNEFVSNDFINEVIKKIVDHKNEIKILLLAGPSSSGKTTTAYRINLFLKKYGIKSITFSTDNYYKDIDKISKDSDGNYEFEKIDALDLDMLQNDLLNLLDGKEVTIPTYNFIAGKKEYKTKAIKLDKDEIIIMEGLHCLNEVMTKKIDKKYKYKIYVSPFLPLGIDRHNHLSTMDLRLIRRIVRDNRTRGASVTDTLKYWEKVKNDEEVYIYNFQKEADVILNTALIYELGVLKVFAEPLLYSVSITSEFYEEARRLLSFLRLFFPISSELVPNYSVLREFIGGSIFY